MKRKERRFVARVYCRGCVQVNTEENQSVCKSGCIACNACADVCKFQAISVGDRNVAVVDDEKCVGCGLCVKACPQGIIHKNISDHGFIPKCSNEEAGVVARKECDNSCIACGICKKNCPMGAITIEHNHAVIDGELCSDCGFCLVVCPRNVIVDVRGLVVKKTKK